MNAIKVNLPILISFAEDYEIDNFGHDVKNILPDVEWIKLDPKKHGYVGLYYVGKLPSEKEIDKMRIK